MHKSREFNSSCTIRLSARGVGAGVLAALLLAVQAMGGILPRFDDFSAARDYADSLAGSIWDGWHISQELDEFTNEPIPFPDGMTSELVRANSLDEPGALALQSLYTNNTRFVMMYINVPADTDFEITTRLVGGDFDSIGTFVPWHSAGLMVKHPTEHLDWVGNMFFSNPQWGATFIGRKLEGGVESNQNTGAEGMNVDEVPWAKLAREGNDFVLAYSADGLDWVEFGRHQHAALLGTDLQVGLAHQMHEDGNTGTAFFGEFMLIPEPGTLGLLGMAGLLLLIRRRLRA